LWSLQLVGFARPSPRLDITARENEKGTHGSISFMTLVRPHEGFEIATVTQSGEAQIPLPQGESVLAYPDHATVQSAIVNCDQALMGDCRRVAAKADRSVYVRFTPDCVAKVTAEKL
jgi:hypothetical protein